MPMKQLGGPGCIPFWSFYSINARDMGDSSSLPLSGDRQGTSALGCCYHSLPFLQGPEMPFAIRPPHVLTTLCLAGGQRHVPDPGSQESDERLGADSEGVLRGLHQVPDISGNSVTQPACCVLEDEGAKEKALGEVGETG